MLNPKFSRRQFLKAGAHSAVLALAGSGLASASEGEIVSAAIHPAIGIARIGNSSIDHYLGPELPGTVPFAPGGFKDPTGAIKRQAARFRIYGLDRNHRVVRELTAGEAEITWRVHLTNAKAAWYDFHTALDIPEAQSTLRRNASYIGAARDALRIDPGKRAISGRCGGPVAFDGGTFLGVEAPLGELRTDDAGRLLVLGGTGQSFSPFGLGLTTFANNDGWCDDTSDGPVTATVRLGRRMVPVRPAWVVVGPPNYGPAIATGYRTLYDVMTQTMIDLRLLSPPSTVSFLSDIYPLFDRLSQLQWVNYGMLERYGWQSPEDFLDPAAAARLADPCPENRPFRRELFKRFRNPEYTTMQPNALPPLYGDAVAIPANSPRDWLAVTPLQYSNLARWANGHFVNDLATADTSAAECLEDLPIEAQPMALDRAALEACLGDAFHPGCEATWPMRFGSMYSGLFRLRHRDVPEPDYGDVLTPEQALAPNGPLDGCVPGSVTRWLAVPWQTDTASCRSGYEPQIDPYLPTFWAARVPNHVFTQESYREVLDQSLPLALRQQAFKTRADFFRDIDRPTKEQTLANMVENWSRLGVVEERPGPGDSSFPNAMKVETERGFPE